METTIKGLAFRVCRPMINKPPLPLIGIIIRILILRPRKRRGFINRASTLYDINNFWFPSHVQEFTLLEVLP